MTGCVELKRGNATLRFERLSSLVESLVVVGDHGQLRASRSGGLNQAILSYL